MRLRRRRAPKVAKLQRKGKLERLVEAAGYSDRLLDRHGQVLDQGAPVRAAAIAALAEYEPPEGQSPPELVGLFAERLRDDVPEVAAAAAGALAADGSRDAAWALVDRLAEVSPAADGEARDAVMDAVRICPCAGISEHWGAMVMGAAERELEEQDRLELETLVQIDEAAEPRQGLFKVVAPSLSRDGEPARRAETILTWCMPAPLDGLEELLGREPVSVAAVRLAGLSGDQGLLPTLERLLEHPAADVRREAATALGGLSDTTAVLSLMGATSDPDVEVRRAAVEALDKLGSAGVTAALAALAYAASRPAEPPEQALGGGPWARTLARLTERSGVTARRLQRAGRDRLAGLVEARETYQEVLRRSE